MKSKKTYLFALFSIFTTGFSVQNMYALAQPKLLNVQTKFAQKLEELRDLLNAQEDRLKDPKFWEDVLNLLRILIPLGVFAVAGVAAYKKTYGTKTPTKPVYGPLPETYTPPAYLAPSPAPYLEPLPQLTMQFFEDIQNLSPSALEYLGYLIPQLEMKYGLARDAILGDKTLISAAIRGNLDPINKAILIRWLKSYGVKLLPGDIQEAASREQIIMNAVSE